MEELSKDELIEIILEQREQIKTLQKQVSDLSRLLGLNSQNSSRPPSTDSDSARRKRKKASRSRRKPGGQPGHKGHHREMLPADQVDEIVSLFPQECQTCQHDLKARPPVKSPIRHQVFELPEKLFSCTEYRLHACRCPRCGKVSRAEPPREVAGRGWGPRLTAWFATLSLITSCSMRQLTDLAQRVFGIPASLGSMNAALDEAGEACADAYHQCVEMVRQSRVVGMDETGWRIGRQKAWAWVMQSKTACAFLIAGSRGSKHAKALLADATPEVVLTDRYKGYDWLPDSVQQYCWAHIARELDGLGEDLNTESKLVRDAIGKVHAKRSEYQQGECSWEDVVRASRRRRAQIEGILERSEARRGEKLPGVMGMLCGDKKQRAWNFVEQEGCELTNNSSERDVRKLVVQRKVSYGSHSSKGAIRTARLYSVFETAKRHHLPLFDTLSRLLYAFRSGQPQLLLAP